jgi:hypothetical protein
VLPLNLVSAGVYWQPDMPGKDTVTARIKPFVLSSRGMIVAKAVHYDTASLSWQNVPYMINNESRAYEIPLTSPGYYALLATSTSRHPQSAFDAGMFSVKEVAAYCTYDQVAKESGLIAECGASSSRPEQESWDFVSVPAAFGKRSYSTEVLLGCNSPSHDRIKGFYFFAEMSQIIHADYDFFEEKPRAERAIFHTAGDYLFNFRYPVATQRTVEFCEDKPSTWPHCKCTSTDTNGKPNCPEHIPCRHEKAVINGKPGKCPFPRCIPPTPPASESPIKCPYEHYTAEE